MIKKVFIDVETTGLDPKKNTIWNLAALMEIDGHLVDQIELKFAPLSGKAIDPQALVHSGVTQQEVEALPMRSPEAFQKFIQFLGSKISPYSKTNKAIFIAYNAHFDNQFVREWFLDNGNKFFGSFFWLGQVCVMSQSLNKLAAERPNMKNFQLSTVAEHLGVNLINAHDALADIKATRTVYRMCQPNWVST